MRVTIDVSPGEAIDKLTIIYIKADRITSPGKLAHIRRESEHLSLAITPLVEAIPVLRTLMASLQRMNERLWDLENAVRDLVRKRDFGAGFIHVASEIHRTNDRRAALKAEINALLGTDIAEQKSYAA